MRAAADEFLDGDPDEYHEKETLLYTLAAGFRDLDTGTVLTGDGRRAFTEDADAAGPVCPACGSDDWDFTVNDRARCVNGHQWDQAPELEGTFVRPGYPGDMNDPERFPD
jgi:hypothetical protein